MNESLEAILIPLLYRKKRLARFDQAPVNIIHKLAFDDEIEVAGPVLRESQRLEPYALVANVCTKGQTHMLAISERKSIEESVTDVLVTRGNQEVVNSVVRNSGARLSDFGFLHMITRAEGDSILADQGVGRRAQAAGTRTPQYA